MKYVYYLQPSSFCFGVKRSITELEKIIRDHPEKEIYCVHELVHNPKITNYLKDMGVHFVQSIYDIYDPEAIVVFSAHGTNRIVLDQAKKKNNTVINLECPFVQKIYKEVEDYIQKGIKTFFYIGKYNHQEGRNVVEYLGSYDVNIFVFDTEKNIPDIDKQETIGILSQTTLNYKDTKHIFEIIKKTYVHAVFPEPSDICLATYERQEVIIQHLDKFDTLVVIGGKESNNGKELYKIGIKNNKKSFFAESLDDLLEDGEDELLGNERIGVTGGASTPVEDIRAVFDYYKSKGYEPKILNLQ